MRTLACLLALLLPCIITPAQNGALNPSFGSGGVVTTPFGAGADEARNLVVQTDGKIVVVGHSFNGANLDFAVVRYNTNGTPDNGFGTSGKVTTNISPGNDEAFGVAIQADGKIVVVGTAGTGNNDFGVVRYNTNGTPDGGFDGDGIVTTDITGLLSDDHGSYVVIQPDGKIVVAGYRNAGSNGDFALVRYTTTGAPDIAFGGGDGIVITDLNGSSEDFASGLLIQPDGKLIASGSSGSGGQVYDFAVARYHTNGTLDMGFGGGDGVVVISIGGDDHCYAAALQHNDGKIVLAGWADMSGQDDFAVMRLNADGSPDSGFDGDGIVNTNIGPGTTDDQAIGVAIQSGGKILLVGNSTNGDFNIVRYNPNGSPDLTFSGDGIASVDLASGQTDFARKVRLTTYNIFVTGYVSMGGNHDFALAAFQNDGFALPLLLTQFTARQDNEEVALQWRTANEQDILQFIVERSNDGKHYTSIGTLAPANTAAIDKHYSFIDEHPLSAVNYYRLQIKDVDGQKQYSKILAIKLNGKNLALQLFPNPVSTLLNVQLPSGLKGMVSLLVMDATGKLIRRLTVESTGGAMATSIPVSGFPPGKYLLRAVTADKQFTASFLKE